MPDATPTETPDDVQDLIDPVTGAISGAISGAITASAGESEVDAIVRAAKAMRDGRIADEAKPAAARTCLIVDDSRVIRKVSSKIAISLGYVPVEAQDGTEALARCRRAMPQLVLTDWDMPEMDGLEFVRQLRAIPTPKPPVVVFCTSKGKATEIHAGIEAGADDYIVKPFDEAGLRAKLEQLGRG
jgi:two-component system chemotaxis response regulator CheY